MCAEEGRGLKGISEEKVEPWRVFVRLSILFLALLFFLFWQIAINIQVLRHIVYVRGESCNSVCVIWEIVGI